MHVIGIDASNIRAGGGITHLSQILAHASSEVRQNTRVVLWGGKPLLGKIEDAGWIQKVNHPWLDRSLPWRLLWQQWKLPGEIRRVGCEVLFSPGAALPLRLPVPAVTISQNMLPFEPRERARFGFSWMRMKLCLLWVSQSSAFRRADGVIFLTKYAKRVVSARSWGIAPKTALVSHGIESRFRAEPKKPDVNDNGEFRLLYVSIVDMYKHQANVAEAVARLRTRGTRVSIEFVGGAYPRALKHLQSTMRKLDPKGEFLFYTGAVEFERLHSKYKQADGFVFASSCENLPNILIEAMSAGLPIACSNRDPMPEVLGENGFYFDPDEIPSIESAISEMVTSPAQRFEKAQRAFEASKSYCWEQTARDTFAFIEEFR